MKKEYIAPSVNLEDIERDSLMIQYSLPVGEDDEDEVGAKGAYSIFDEGFMEDYKSDDFSPLFESKEFYTY